VKRNAIREHAAARGLIIAVSDPAIPTNLEEDMPFVRGRYHINPIVGAALEAAREADEALAALQQTEQNEPSGSASDSDRPAKRTNGSGPIHRVEIETAELVPSHSGRGQRGFVARVHRVGGAVETGANSTDEDNSVTAPTWSGAAKARDPRQNCPTASPETHVFSDHQDLVNFLQDEFQKDHER
jgi:hypothetical protein